ncbi:secreted RxLR effector protein 161-like [Cornus florida]|uniref:secreted RxLR effector protein 161-like n=1 Tax=Cornus florida TaxID=4283 RepID=UPI0028A0EE81|nr:secreted RxLR effector protein 161-like [Cornus florida]
MSISSKLDRDSDPNKVDPSLYRSMIGSLLYLAASRPDISFSVGVCARYQADPREQHVFAIKCIIRYVNSYADADWASKKDDRKSTLCGCFYIGTNIVSWYNKKQNFISLSSCEAEYNAARSCCIQLLRMKQMLLDYGVDQGYEISLIYCLKSEQLRDHMFLELGGD